MSPPPADTLESLAITRLKGVGPRAAERLARLVAIWGRVPDIDETVARIDAVTAGDVREFAANMISRSQAAMALYGPIDRAPVLQDLQARLAG